jgi:hypothetical protein
MAAVKCLTEEYQVKVLVFLTIVIVNYLCLWYLLSFMGINGVHSIGFQDSFGYVFPPKWFFLLIAFVSIIEYVVLTTFFPLKKDARQVISEK